MLGSPAGVAEVAFPQRGAVRTMATEEHEMKLHHRHLGRLAALAVVVALPLASGVGTAGAAVKHARACAKHARTKRCQGSGTASTQDLTLTVSPNPLVEAGPSQIRAVVQVEALPQFAGDQVTLSSSQLVATCASSPNPVQFVTNAGGPTPGFFTNTINVTLDDDGNATVALYGTDCAPGQDLIEADLDAAPFLTAVTTLAVLPPAVTTEGISAFPNDEVETGDTMNSGDSDVYAVFYVETDPVYAEQRVVINSTQLESRCATGWWWQGGNGGSAASSPPQTTANGPTTQLDDDGNAVFVFFGTSCAAGDSVVTADVEAGPHPTYDVDFTILPPAVTTRSVP